MTGKMHDRMLWYIEHRLEFLQKRRDNLKSALDAVATGDFDFEALRELLETRGRIQEIELFMTHMESW